MNLSLMGMNLDTEISKSTLRQDPRSLGCVGGESRTHAIEDANQSMHTNYTY